MLRFFSFAFFLFSSTTLYSQYSMTRSYSEGDGMAPGIVNTITQDQYGYIWIGTRNGLSRFDGRNFKSYCGDLASVDRLRGSEIFDLASTTDGDLWIGTSSGLVFFDSSCHSFRTYTSDDGLTMDMVRSVSILNDSILWIGHWYGLDRINIKNWKVEYISPTDRGVDTLLHHRSPNHIKETKVSIYDNKLYFCHQNFIQRYNHDSSKIEKLFDVHRWDDGYISDFEWLNKDNILITTTLNNYYILNLNTLNGTAFTHDSKWEIVKILKAKSDDILGLDRHRGLVLFNKETMKFVGNESTTKNPYYETFTNFFIDNEGHIWCGSLDNVMVYENVINRYYNFSNIDISTTIYDSSTQTLLGLDFAGPIAWSIEKGQLVRIPFSNTRISKFNIIYSNRLASFVSFDSVGFTLFHPQIINDTTISLSESITGRILEIMEVDDGFIISAGRHIYRVSMQGDLTTILDFEKEVYGVLEFNDGLFFSTIGGLYYFKNNEIDLIYSPPKINRVRGMTMTGDTSMWFTVINKGLIELDIRNETYIPKYHGVETGLQSQIMFGIFKDGDNFLIPATYCFYVFNPSMKKVTNTYRKGTTTVTYDLANEIYNVKDSFYLTGVSPGIMIFPKQSEICKIQDLRIEQVTVRGQKPIYEIPSNLHLAYSDNDINIQFCSYYYGEKSDVKYHYKLDQHVEYQPIGTNPELNFSRLQPGEYDISIKAVSGSHEKVIEHAISFKVNPPWWATLWFYVIASLILPCILYLWYIRRVTYLKNQHLTEVKLVHLESQALISQINPHFLFNAMSGIRTLIALGENERAKSYVTHLSRLLRDSLTYHQTQQITLKQELDMNRHYLALAQLRYDNKLQWTIVSNDVNCHETVSIPPFSIQPLIENAIHHGIRYLDGEGLIEIIIKNSSENIEILVRDNGVGLQKIAKLNEEKILKRKSIGLEIVEKRLVPLGGQLKISDRKYVQGVDAIITIPVNRSYEKV